MIRQDDIIAPSRFLWLLWHWLNTDSETDTTQTTIYITFHVHRTRLHILHKQVHHTNTDKNLSKQMSPPDKLYRHNRAHTFHTGSSLRKQMEKKRLEFWSIALSPVFKEVISWSRCPFSSYKWTPVKKYTRETWQQHIQLENKSITNNTNIHWHNTNIHSHQHKNPLTSTQIFTQLTEKQSQETNKKPILTKQETRKTWDKKIRDHKRTHPRTETRQVCTRNTNMTSTDISLLSNYYCYSSIIICIY